MDSICEPSTMPLPLGVPKKVIVSRRRRVNLISITVPTSETYSNWVRALLPMQLTSERCFIAS